MLAIYYSYYKPLTNINKSNDVIFVMLTPEAVPLRHLWYYRSHLLFVFHFTAKDTIPPGETTPTPGVSLEPTPVSTGDGNYPSTGQNTTHNPATSKEYVSGDRVKPTIQHQPRTTKVLDGESVIPTSDDEPASSIMPVSTNGDDESTTQQLRSTEAPGTESDEPASFGKHYLIETDSTIWKKRFTNIWNA